MFWAAAVSTNSKGSKTRDGNRWRLRSGSPRTRCCTGVSTAPTTCSCRGTDAAIAFPPSEINYRANIDALKRAGVTDLISVSACGSLREDLPPGSFVLVDQFVDRTFARSKTFFETGCVAHVSMADPVCARLQDALEAAAAAASIQVVRGGTYLAMEGPQFSSRAESHLYRAWGCDVIGMTNMPEAKLAREAEICYASVAMVTDFDCWHPSEADVEVSDIVAVLTDNAARGRSLVAGLARLPPRSP